MTEKADRVEQLLSNPDFKQALEDVLGALLRAFSETPPSEVEQLVDCRKRLHLLDSVEANLKQAIQDGRLEDFNAEQKGQGILGDLSSWTSQKKRFRR